MGALPLDLLILSKVASILSSSNMTRGCYAVSLGLNIAVAARISDERIFGGHTTSSEYGIKTLNTVEVSSRLSRIYVVYAASAKSGPGERPISAAAYSSLDVGARPVEDAYIALIPETVPRKAKAVPTAALTSEGKDAGGLSESQQTGSVLPDAMWFFEGQSVPTTTAPCNRSFAAALSATTVVLSSAARNGRVACVNADAQLKASQSVNLDETPVSQPPRSAYPAQPPGGRNAHSRLNCCYIVVRDASEIRARAGSCRGDIASPGRICCDRRYC